MATLPLADVVDGLVVHHEGTVGVLQGGVGTQGGVVGLHHGRGHLIERQDYCASARCRLLIT